MMGAREGRDVRLMTKKKKKMMMRACKNHHHRNQSHQVKKVPDVDEALPIMLNQAIDTFALIISGGVPKALKQF